MVLSHGPQLYVIDQDVQIFASTMLINSVMVKRIALGMSPIVHRADWSWHTQVSGYIPVVYKHEYINLHSEYLNQFTTLLLKMALGIKMCFK